LESKEENLPYETVVIKTKLKERESTRKGSLSVDTTQKNHLQFKIANGFDSLDFFL
jgi:hypothetical protein